MRHWQIAVCLLTSAQAVLAQDHAHSRHQMTTTGAENAASSLPREAGQSAFGAIAEAVAMLEADPATDWPRVNITALREHLVDMENVTIHARVTSEEVPNGARFVVDGEGVVRDSIRRMTMSHASMIEGDSNSSTLVSETPSGVVMTVIGNNAAEGQRIRALGFFGAMTRGVHHQLHHIMMARGRMHH